MKKKIKKKKSIIVYIIILAIIIVTIVNIVIKIKAKENFESEYNQLMGEYSEIEIGVEAFGNQFEVGEKDKFDSIKVEVDEAKEISENENKYSAKSLDESREKCNKIRIELQEIQQYINKQKSILKNTDFSEEIMP